MTTEQLLNERWTRLKRSIALERPDRTPVVLEYAGFAAHVTQTPMAEFLGSSTKPFSTWIQIGHGN